jgi:murein L,D-transpeptidase YafK
VTDKVRIVSRGEVESRRGEVLAMIEDWRNAWAGKRIDDYIRHYSPQFSAQGMNREQWRARKAGLSKVNGAIRIALTDFTVLRQKDGMVVSFIQDYSAENVSNIGLKTLYLIEGNDGPRIVTEYFQKN